MNTELSGSQSKEIWLTVASCDDSPEAQCVEDERDGGKL